MLVADHDMKVDISTRAKNVRRGRRRKDYDVCRCYDRRSVTRLGSEIPMSIRVLDNIINFANHAVLDRSRDIYLIDILDA